MIIKFGFPDSAGWTGNNSMPDNFFFFFFFFLPEIDRKWKNRHSMEMTEQAFP